MQPISVVKRLLFYVFLLFLTFIGVVLVICFGGRGALEGKDYVIIFVYLIPHYILGYFFLQTNKIIKLVVPLITSIVSFGSLWLIVRTEVFNNFDLVIFIAFFLPIVLVWELVYQILIHYHPLENQQKKQ